MPCLYATTVNAVNVTQLENMMDPSPTNQIWLWQGALLMASQSLTNTPHLHFPASLYVGLDGALTVTTDTGPVVGRVVLVRANCEQSVDSKGGRVVDVLVDADSAAYRYIEPVLQDREAIELDYQAVEHLQATFDQAVLGELCCQQAWALVEEMLISVSAYRPQRIEFDPRIEKVAAFLRANLPVNPEMGLLAEQAGLSESRFMHLFKQQYGLPVRQYLLWARLVQAATLWTTGKSLADIAAEVGFYDQAHFARTVRRMFDFSPSWLTNPANIKLHYCNV